ncbi:hypothetical protein [Halobellus rarus]|uniref:Uncharacterized protein n=1 Tax=Halobellus rarus TaxID=1126237 RepID=A0ABD6CNS2_9EURY|nr:hypothetical protein [Halobellus rarus]
MTRDYSEPTIERMSSSLQGTSVTGPSSTLPIITCSPTSIPDLSTASGGTVTTTEEPSSRTFRVLCSSASSSVDIGSNTDPGPQEATGQEKRLITDGGSFEELNALERQADALEEIAEQQRIQNAALLELIRTFDHRLPELHDHPPAEPTPPRSGRSLAGWVEDAALDLDERVDLDAVDRVSEGSQ